MRGAMWPLRTAAVTARSPRPRRPVERVAFFLALLLPHVLVARGASDGADAAVLSERSEGVPAVPLCEFDCEGGSTAAGSEAAANAEARRLAATGNITNKLINNATVLYVLEQGGQYSQAPCHPLSCQGVDMYAGVNYTTVLLQVSLMQFYEADNAAFKIVDSEMTWPTAMAGQCLTNAFKVNTVNPPWSDIFGVSTTASYGALAGAVGYAEGGTLQSDSLLSFKMGGNFRICYSQDGSFGSQEGYVAPVPMFVSGVRDVSPSCRPDDPKCLANHRYECYLRKSAFNTFSGKYSLQTSCVVDFSYPGAGFVGQKGMGSWSAEFAATYSSTTGLLIGGVVEQPCGTTAATFICSNGGACKAGTPFIDMTLVSSVLGGGTGRIYIPTTSETLVGTLGDTALRARSVAACYCPARGDCSVQVQYVQRIGLLHFYLSKICYVNDLTCKNDYNGVTGQYNFRVRVECPTDACANNLGSRIKFVEKTMVGGTNLQELPSWDSANGCRTAIHGLMFVPAGSSLFPYSQKYVLPPLPWTLLSGTYSGSMNPVNCPGGPLSCTVNGGLRQDYKEFGGTLGFRYIMGYTQYEQRTFESSRDVDVCYCNDLCTSPGNWFKVGSFRVSPTRLVSSATSRSNSPAQWSLEFTNQPGMLALNRPYADGNVLGLQVGSLLKIVADPERELRDQTCGQAGYSSQLTDGLANEVAASMNYQAKPQTQTPVDLQKLVWNNDALANSITVKVAGTIAVCYCDVTQDSVCLDVENWKLVTHITIKGPQTNQAWQFSTNVVFRFSFLGYGLSSKDSLRIISSDGDCTANNYNPDTAAWAYTGLSVKCPEPCTEVGQAASAEPGDLPVLVAGSSAYRCNENNTNCGVNDITTVVVIDASTTEITFQQPHDLEDGEITLGDNIFCEPTDNSCTPEMVSALKGVYNFADLDNKNGFAPNTYMNAQRFYLTDDPRKIRIKMGWPAPAPRFKVIFAGATLKSIGRGGQWTSRSIATTREEILGVKEKANLRVCWRFGDSAAPKYVVEVGKLTLRDPGPMIGATISMSQSGRGIVAPMIITFTTAGGLTGLRYDEAEDSLRLKITFTQVDQLDIKYTTTMLDGTLDIPASVPGDDTYAVASQAICGKLFLEMWSEDMANGFPMPEGCYYKSFLGAITPRREIFLIFPAKSGLRKSTKYQLVVNGVVNGSIPVKDMFFGEITPMDDVTNRPYEAIERGLFSLNSVPQPVGTDIEDPRFRQPGGFKIVGGYLGLLELMGGEALNFELMGDPRVGGITAGCFIRIYLWPLTQWQTTSSCSAQCVFSAEVSFKCGPITVCRGVSTVEGGNLNILQIAMPDSFDQLYGNAKIGIRVSSVSMPSGGFFANRLAAQVTRRYPSDDRPNYIISSGDLIWKQPANGQQVAKMVSPMGGGDPRPFQGDKGNILYAMIILSSTIFSRDDSLVDASFTITLPPGYTCLNGNPLNDAAGNVLNAWEAETTLPVIANMVPQGRGSPSDGTPMHGWTTSGNTCSFRPRHPYGVVYAGSSIYVKMLVNNPQQALPLLADRNVWTIRMANKGMHNQIQVTKNYPFQASGNPMYQSAAVVLGIITEASCQPSVFAVSTPLPVAQSLNFFFRSQQEIDGGGFVRVVAPFGFSFTTPCQASNLDKGYYATQAISNDATLPLPGTLNCTTTGRGQQADIAFSLILAAGRRFAFRVVVQNPKQYDPSQLLGWRLYTGDEFGNLIDGTPQTVPFTSNDANSWAVYAGPFIPGNDSSWIDDYRVTIAVKVIDLRPYSMRVGVERRTYLQVRLRDVPDTLRLPAGNSGFIRFTAPKGYIFQFDDSEFVYQTAANAPSSHLNYIPDDVNADLPSGIPSPRDGTGVLIFRPGIYRPLGIYAFAAMVKVPDFDPPMTNAFFLEFGFNATLPQNRLGAATIPALPVRALKNANIEYSTNIVGKENQVEFRVQTVTAIPQGGGLEIIVPQGFVIQSTCELVQVRDPAYGPPPDFSCQAVLDSLGRTRLRLRRVVATDLAPGVLSFGVVAENPSIPILNYATTTPSTPGLPFCGYFVCWYFFSQARIATATVPAGENLDLQTSAVGFTVNAKMLEASIPLLTEEQRRGTNRDDRPAQPNNVIFAFKLSNPISAQTTILLMAPYGFQIPEECLPTVEVREEYAFGLGNRFPPAFTPWPAGVSVSSCRGVANKATMTLSFLPSAIMQAMQLYIIRIGIQQNPMATPIPNFWLLQIGRETAEPIVGMTLWAFTETSLVPTTTARQQTLVGEQPTVNPMTFFFRPFNSLPSGGELRLEAQPGFQFVSLPSRECSVELQERPYLQLGIDYPGYQWDPSELVCLVDALVPYKLSVRLKGQRAMNAGLDHRLLVSVYNPASATFGSDPTQWMLSSWLPNGLSLDQTTIIGFRVNSVMNLWTYSNPNPAIPGEEMRNGNARLTNFRLYMRFPDDLRPGDVVNITVPPAFDITDISGKCSGFFWVDPTKDSQSVGFNALPNTPPKCLGSTLTLQINEPTPIPQDTLLVFGLDIYNPTQTPHISERFWSCTQYRGSLLLSTKSFESWQIISQLDEILIDILGPPFAAESISTIRIQFTPVSDAEELVIVASSPSGFDFSGATLGDPLTQKLTVKPPVGNTIQIGMRISGGQQYRVDISGVVLASGGGQTTFQLTTWAGGLMQGGKWNSGTKLDQRLDYTGGFRLPGRVVTSLERLYTDFTQDPIAYPVQAAWNALMGRPAYIEFRFYMQQPAVAGNYLQIFARPYQPTLRTFILQEAPSNIVGASGLSGQPQRAIASILQDTANLQFDILLQEPLVPMRIYDVILSVITPSAMDVQNIGIPIRWTIQTTDGKILPLNTNDASTREFPIVEEYSFDVQVARAPPNADTVVSVSFASSVSVPTALRIVAPLGFNFSAGCLVSGGGVVVGCGPGKPMVNGQASAVLSLISDGIRGKTNGISIMVRTPAKTPVFKEWFIEGLDKLSDIQIGWGQSAGFNIDQMADTSVVYAGVPLMREKIIWHFRCQVVVKAGGWLEVKLPMDMNPDCGGSSFEAIALPLTGACNAADPTSLKIYLNSTIMPGEYAFSFFVTPPISTPYRNTMSLILRDAAGLVKDAAVDLPAPLVQDKLRIEALPLTWSQSRAGRASTISLGFTCLETLPLPIIAPDQQVAEVLIILPIGFTHLVEQLSDFTLVNEDMPLRQGVWLDYMQKDKLRISLELNLSTTVTTLKQGTYEFQFPVLVPSLLPVYNVWFLSLCSPSYINGCMLISDPAVLLTFPMTGFKLGQATPQVMATSNLVGAAAGAAERVCRGPLSTRILLVLLGASWWFHHIPGL